MQFTPHLGLLRGGQPPLLHHGHVEVAHHAEQRDGEDERGAHTAHHRGEQEVAQRACAHIL
mgnify:CR=1